MTYPKALDRMSRVGNEMRSEVLAAKETEGEARFAAVLKVSRLKWCSVCVTSCFARSLGDVTRGTGTCSSRAKVKSRGCSLEVVKE